MRSTRDSRHDLSQKPNDYPPLSDQVRSVWLLRSARLRSKRRANVVYIRCEVNYDDLREKKSIQRGIVPLSLDVNKELTDLLYEERTRLIDVTYLQLYFSLASRLESTRWKLAGGFSIM